MIEALRGAHWGASDDGCYECGTEWPCDTTVLLDALGAAKVRSRRLCALLDKMLGRAMAGFVDRWGVMGFERMAADPLLHDVQAALDEAAPTATPSVVVPGD